MSYICVIPHWKEITNKIYVWHSIWETKFSMYYKDALLITVLVQKIVHFGHLSFPDESIKIKSEKNILRQLKNSACNYYKIQMPKVS